MQAGARPAQFAVSIVIVTCDRQTDLRRCLRELQTHLTARATPSYEVLTVHAPGDDACMAMVRAEFPFVRAIASERRNISAQRNLGARCARGEVLIYLDDDAWPQAGWLPALAGAFADAAVVAATGPVFRADGSQQYGPMLVTAMGRPYPVPPGTPAPAGQAPTFPGCNLAIRRRALFAIGGFDERLAYHFDDVDVCLRLFVHHGRDDRAMAYVPAARIHHEPSPGPFRRTLHDRAWYVVAMNSIYFAFRHAGALRATVGAGWLQAPKLLRFASWLCSGKLGPIAFARCVAKQIAGMVAGYLKGCCRGALLPLAPLPEPPPTEALTAATPAPCRQPAQV